MRLGYTNTRRTKLNPIRMNTPASPLHYPKYPTKKHHSCAELADTVTAKTTNIKNQKNTPEWNQKQQPHMWVIPKRNLCNNQPPSAGKHPKKKHHKNGGQQLLTPLTDAENSQTTATANPVDASQQPKPARELPTGLWQHHDSSQQHHDSSPKPPKTCTTTTRKAPKITAGPAPDKLHVNLASKRLCPIRVKYNLNVHRQSTSK